VPGVDRGHKLDVPLTGTTPDDVGETTAAPAAEGKTSGKAETVVGAPRQSPWKGILYRVVPPRPL
jgi:hypothetical protein